MASIQPRIDTAPPGGTFAKTVPSTSRSPAAASNQRATASNLGLDWGVGRPPMTFESVMSTFGASQTSRSSSGRSSSPEWRAPAPRSVVIAALPPLGDAPRGRLQGVSEVLAPPPGPGAPHGVGPGPD